MSRELRMFFIAGAIAIGLGVLFYALGFGDAESPGVPVPEAEMASTTLGSAVKFAVLAKGVQGSVTTRTNYLITSSAQLHELWEIVGSKDAQPPIDFTEQQVIAVFAGEPQAAISVANVADAAKRTITVALTKPNPACPSAKPSVGAAYEVVVLPATSLALAHVDTAATSTCASK